MRTFALASLWLAVSVVAPAQEPSPLEALASKAALAQFERDAGGRWIAQWHPATGTPSAVYGTGMKLEDWRENSLEEARRHANLVLVRYAEMLGLGDSDFTEIIGARMGRTWSFTFDQSYRGLPVIEGRADVRINMKGVVAMLGSRAWPIPAKFDVTPAIDAGVATAIAWDALGEAPTGVRQPVPPRQPRLVIWGDIASPALAPVFLAWEVAISNVAADGAGTIGRYYVDAKTGQVLRFETDKHECAVAGCTGGAHPATALPSLPPVPTVVTLQAWTRTGADAYSALVNVPLPGVEVSVPGVGTRVTDANGQFTIDINAPVTINVGALNGRHHQTIQGPNAPTASVTVQPGVPATIQLSSSGASTNEAAHPTLTWWTDATNEWCRSILGNSSQLNTASNVAVQANISSTCNAYYTGNSINFYQQGGGCANTAFSTVIAHEWGHGIDDRYGGIANSNAEGVSEGWGDILGMYLVDSPLLGSGFQSPGQPLRNGNNSRVWPYSSGSPHGAGQVWMGFAWRLREALRASQGTPQAIAITEDIVVGSIVADATTRVDAVREVFIADDDDGNLLNGTPHYAELSSAANQKGIPFPEVQLLTLDHNALGATNQQLTPREVYVLATPISGAITELRLVYDAGAGQVVRTMYPTGTPNQYLAMLPGLQVGAVDYRIEALHSTGAVVRLPETGDFTYSVTSGTFGTFWSEGFESGAPGWVSAQVATQNDWQLGDPVGRSGTSQGVAWADPADAAVGTNCYGNDLGIGNFNGAYQPNVYNYLRSPVIDCTGRTGVRLRFRRWLSVEQAIYDQATLLVNGQQVWQNPLNQNLVDTSWQTVEYTIPWADNNPSVQIEWRLQTDAGLNLGGWTIDEVELGETILNQTDATLTFLPERVEQNDPMTLTVTTPGGPRPYLLILGDAIGPTIVPGFPVVLAGGNLTILGGATDASGNDVIAATAPSLPGGLGQRYYSQVLTVDAAFTQFVVSNRFINWITP